MRHDVGRIEVRAPTVTIEISANHEVPTDIIVILPRIVEGVAPPTRTQLIHVLRISHWSPYPSDAHVSSGTEILLVGNVDTPHADAKDVLTHVSLHGFDCFSDFIERHTSIGLPCIGSASVIGMERCRFFTNLFYLLAYKARVAVLRFPPVSAFLSPHILTLRDNYLYPHLFAWLQDAHSLQDLGERVYSVLFFRVFIELKIYVRTYGIRIIARLVAPVGRKSILRIGVKPEFRGIIFRLSYLDLGIVCIHHGFDIGSPIAPTPDIEMYLATERSYLKRKIWQHLTLPRRVKKCCDARIKPQHGKCILHGARRASDVSRHFYLKEHRITLKEKP